MASSADTTAARGGPRPSQSMQAVLNNRPRVARALLDASPPFEYQELADRIKPADWTRLHTEDIIQHASRTGGRDTRWQWRLTPRGRQAAEHAKDRHDGGPWPRCDHRGLHTIEPGRYTCQHPDCTKEYTRAEAREAMH